MKALVTRRIAVAAVTAVVVGAILLAVGDISGERHEPVATGLRAGPERRPSSNEDPLDLGVGHRYRRLKRVTRLTCTPGHQLAALQKGAGAYCVPFDSIPAIRHPQFVPASRATFLDAAEPVVSVTVQGQSRAYPVSALLYHEIVNDVIGGRPIVISFCPLCNSAVAYLRRVGARTLTFGVSGELFHANLVMFDRQTLSFWKQISGRAFSGTLAGRHLRPVPAFLTSFGTWRRSHPAGPVMKEPSLGYHYGFDPYASYGRDPTKDSIFYRPPPGSKTRTYTDPRLPPKSRVIGVLIGGRAVAFAAPHVGEERRVATIRVNGRTLVALFRFGIAQPETAARLAHGRRGWEATVWRASVKGRPTHIVATPAGFVDRTTHSRVGLFGRFLSGPLAGRRMYPVLQLTSFWFAWAAYHPHTRLVQWPQGEKSGGRLKPPRRSPHNSAGRQAQSSCRASCP